MCIRDLILAKDFLEKEHTPTIKKTEAGATLQQDKTQQLKGFSQTANLLASGKLFTITKPIKEAWRSSRIRLQS